MLAQKSDYDICREAVRAISWISAPSSLVAHQTPHLRNTTPPRYLELLIMIVPLAIAVARDRQSLKGWSFVNRGIEVLVPREAVTRSIERREERRRVKDSGR